MIVIRLSHDAYLEMREGARVVEADRHGDKVLLLADGSYFKMFRRKRLVSSALWNPYAKRFATNAAALAACGVACPEVIRVCRIPSIARDAVNYRPLEGRTLRQAVRSADAGDALRLRFGAFVAHLHRLGVYFRSLHLGNVILTPDGGFGLIDIADMTVRRRPVGQRLLDRNLRHLCRYEEDREWLGADDGRQFAAGYESLSGLRPVLPIQTTSGTKA